MIGSRIPTNKRIVNNPSYPPLNPSDFSEANALNLMFLWDNMGSGEYLNDGSILARHIDNLFVHEQNTPNLTLSVDPGRAAFGASNVLSAGGNTSTILAPISNPRRDVVTLKSDGTISVVTGVEGASPAVPATPAGQIALAQVYCVVGMTTIHDNDTQVAGQGYIEYDLRPFLGIGGTVINSIQQGNGTVSIGGSIPVVAASAVLKNATTVTITASGTDAADVSLDVTITSVNTSKAYVVFNGYAAGGSGPGSQITVYFTVVEFA